MAGAVAFFRNLNLGQSRSHSPTRTQLLDAFAVAGARRASSFQTNGTVIFSPQDPREPAERLATRVVEILTPVCGYADAVLVRSGAWVIDLTATLEPMPKTTEVALFDLPGEFPVAVPWISPGGHLEVVHADRWHAICVNAVDRTSFATKELERLLDVPVTARGAGTFLRLESRLAGDAAG